MRLLKSSFLKHAGTLFSGTAVAQGLGLLILPILTSQHFYSKEEFGVFTLFASLVSVGIVFSGLRMELGIVPAEKDEEARSLLQLSLLINLTWALVMLVSIWLFKTHIAALFSFDPNSNWIYLVPATIALTGMTEALIANYNRQKKYTTIASSKIVNSGTSNSTKLLMPFLKNTGTGLLLGQLLGQAVTFIFVLFKNTPSLFRDINFQGLKSVFVRHKNLAWFSTPAALVNVLALMMPVFLLSHFFGKADTGLFGNARTLIFVPLSYISLSFGQVFYERISRLKNDVQKSAEDSDRLIHFLFFLAIVPVLVIAIWGNKIIPFILGEEWMMAGEYAQVMVFFFFAVYLTNPFAGAFVIYDKLKTQLLYNFTFFLLTSLGMYLAIEHGFSAKESLAVYATIGTILRLLILNYFFKLYGSRMLLKTLITCAIIVVLLACAFSLTGSFPL